MITLLEKKFSDCDLIFTNPNETICFKLHKYKLAKRSKYFNSLFDMNIGKTYNFPLQEHDTLPTTLLFDKLYHPKMAFHRLDENCYHASYMNIFVSMLYYYQLDDSIIGEYVFGLIASCEPNPDQIPISIKFGEKLGSFYAHVKENSWPFSRALGLIYNHFVYRDSVHKPFKVFDNTIMMLNTFMADEMSNYPIPYSCWNNGAGDFNHTEPHSFTIKTNQDSSRSIYFPNDESMWFGVFLSGPQTLNNGSFSGELLLTDGFNIIQKKLNPIRYGPSSTNINTRLRKITTDICYYGYLLLKPDVNQNN